MPRFAEMPPSYPLGSTHRSPAIIPFMGAAIRQNIAAEMGCPARENLALRCAAVNGNVGPVGHMAVTDWNHVSVRM